MAKEGANIVVVAKSITENPKLGGTIFSAAEEIEAAGGKALAVACDIRDENQVQSAVDKAVEHFGGIDILINNASAISLTNTEQTEPKRFDLMHDINVRGTFFVSRACIPHLKKGTNAHIVTLSPPINMDMKWFANHIAYTLSKYNMSMIALGLAAELTSFATAAVQNLLGGDALINMSRKPEIVADACYHILCKPSTTYTGQTLIDENVLAEEGITDLSAYAVVPGAQLFNDLFI
jgi:citronellol/citronellal dehydrogenase